LTNVRPGWYPDWAGETIVVVASGPSATAVPLELGRNRARFIAVKTSLALCPRADVLYACDFLWWDQRRGAPNFPGLKISVNRRACDMGWGVQYLRCGIGTSAMEFDDLGRVGWGGNSGFNAVNFAAQLAPARIILVGFDMTLSNGTRWHADHPGQSVNPNANIVERWRRALDNAAPALAAHGIRVFNCSLGSALTNYEKMDFRGALQAASISRA
jgi:hypothetical protein